MEEKMVELIDVLQDKAPDVMSQAVSAMMVQWIIVFAVICAAIVAVILVAKEATKAINDSEVVFIFKAGATVICAVLVGFLTDVSVKLAQCIIAPDWVAVKTLIDSIS